jgi:hypothetical protein
MKTNFRKSAAEQSMEAKLKKFAGKSAEIYAKTWVDARAYREFTISFNPISLCLKF